jgi:hypothetical protein
VKLNAQRARELRERFAKGTSIKALAEQYNVSETTIRDVLLTSPINDWPAPSPCWRRDYLLGGQLKTGNLWTAQNRQFPAAETSEFYFVPTSVCKSVCTLVRQLRGPHLSTCA